MPDHRTSLQSQSTLADAKNSVVKASHAIHQAESHTSDEMLEQANNALNKASNAAAAASDADNKPAVQQIQEQLSDLEQDFGAAVQNQKDL